MGAERKCFLLAVVLLLEAASRAEEGGTSCEVVEVTGTVATVNCGVVGCGYIQRENRTSGYHRPNNESTSTMGGVATMDGFNRTLLEARQGELHHKNASRNSTIREDSTGTDVNNKNFNRSLEVTSLKKVTINDSLHSIRKRNKTFSDHNFESNSGNKTQAVTAEKLNLSRTADGINHNSTTVTKPKLLNTINESASSQPTYSRGSCLTERSRNSFINIKTVNINLQNISVIDLSLFPNATTLIIHGTNISISKVRGAENISELSAVSLGLENITFIKKFGNLTHLNLTNNRVRKLSVLELPSSITFLFLAHNEIIIESSVVLPKLLRVLNVSANNLSLASNVCLQGNVKIVDLSKNHMNQVPCLVTTDLEELYLSENNLSTIVRDDLKNILSLTVLDLRRNRISKLEETVFEGLNRLQKLDLSQNQIEILAPSTFQYLNNLVVLSLSENANIGNLQDFNKDASFLFGTGQRLRTIDASRTNLSRIPPTLTRSVRQLFLRHNVISSIQCGELDSFPLLQTMDLSHNLVAEVEEDAFGRLDFLSYLVLYDNKLTSIPTSLPAQLEVLDLRFNFIGKLHGSDLLGLQKLKALLLSNNKVTAIEDNSFGQLVSLEVLDLSHNPIKALSRTSLMGPRELKQIYLVSLTDLIPFQEPLSFPAPESGHLEVLNMDSSPVLATQLMDDVAALTMFHELFELNLNHCRLSTLRSDLPKYLPRLHKLELSGNRLNCSNIIWLVRWLQTLNISMQDSGKFRREMYNLKDICCEGVDEVERSDVASVMCYSPEHLAGRPIISLKEEDFPDLKLTSATLPPSRELLSSKPYHPQTSTNLIDSLSTTSSIYSVTDNPLRLSSPQSTQAISHEVEDKLLTTITYKPYVGKLFSSNDFTTKSSVNKQEDLTRQNSINRARKSWKYSNLDSKTSFTDPIMVLLNETKNMIRDFDNHLNDTISSGAFQSHEVPRDSHPGMVVFLLLVGVMLGAALVMVYSQCSQNRRGRRKYQHQQDIEVTSLGGQELW